MNLTGLLRRVVSPGVAVPHRKGTAELKTAALPLPKTVILSMSQHIGAPCVPLVEIGDPVSVGQIVADSERPVSVPIHSSVSGTVTGVREITLPGGQPCSALEITSDGAQTVHESVRPPLIHTKEDFITAIRRSGLAGLGGAGFPAHIKLASAAFVDTLLINAAECEPYITSDYRECIENAPDILFGIRKVMEYLQIPRAIIGIESNKPKAAALLRELCGETKENIRVKTLPARYPHGAEKVLINLCTGRRVPPGKLPADVGCLVMNVTSIGFLGRYLQTGMPLVEKRLTVAGAAVTRPGNIRVPIGTPVSEVLAFCGLDEEKAAKLLMGGPMMGLALMTPDLPILKQNNAILALDHAEARTRPQTACIRCGRCARNCPMHLEPLTIESAYKLRDTDALKRLHVMSCIECGCCSFVCPAARHLTQSMRLSKQEVRRLEK